MRQNELAPAAGSKRRRKRVGRGLGSGHGRYSTRGSKGQKSRSGAKIPAYFEGGQLPLVKRLPTKGGFTNIFRKEYSVVNIGRLNTFESGTLVDHSKLLEAGLIRSARKPVKVLSVGELNRSLVIRADKFSTAAKKKIEAAGGSVEEAGSATKAR
ncbi:MAG: 50S ribosomal protein L15 [Dehalococcoidia bacterium]|nr:50S ribosomal protein L15 [Dehalococcoidia bacterium]